MIPGPLHPSLRRTPGFLGLLAVLAGLAPATGVAQTPPPADTLEVLPDSVEALASDSVPAPVTPPDSVPAGYDEFAGRIRPSGAFLRAVLFPGWGHASIGVNGRGGFYLGTQAVVGWMLLRTRSGLSSARQLVDLRSAPILRALAEDEVTDPTAIEEALAEDEGVARARGLEASRQQQYEDWLALGIFTVLLSGADAFVSAHLQPFPVDVGVVPVGDQGRMELSVRVPVGGAARR